MQLESLEGKVAVVTGASSGIGEAAARELVAEGVSVLLVARSAENIENLAQELGEPAVAVPTDVGDEDQVRALFERIERDYGGIDLLFNNAGVGYNGKFEEGDTEEWRATIDANLYGCSSAPVRPYRCCVDALGR